MDNIILAEALKEIFRILKPGGRFICLEFSQVQDKHFKKLYIEIVNKKMI